MQLSWSSSVTLAHFGAIFYIFSDNFPNIFFSMATNAIIQTANQKSLHSICHTHSTLNSVLLVDRIYNNCWSYLCVCAFFKSIAPPKNMYGWHSVISRQFLKHFKWFKFSSTALKMQNIFCSVCSFAPKWTWKKRCK